MSSTVEDVVDWLATVEDIKNTRKKKVFERELEIKRKRAKLEDLRIRLKSSYNPKKLTKMRIRGESK